MRTHCSRARPQGQHIGFDLKAGERRLTRILLNNANDEGDEGVDDKTAKKLIRGYMASTTYADAQMGKIIKALKEEGLYDNTIIIVFRIRRYII